MSYSTDAIIEDCYKDTTCLINKLGITDEKKLQEFESAITLAKASEIENQKIAIPFDTKDYKMIHKYLFEDIYEWAGNFRTINMSKNGTPFSEYKYIDELMDGAFFYLREKSYFKKDTFDEFIEDIVDFYCTTNIIHPFREGNGRVQRLFIAQLVRYNDYDIDFARVDKDELLIATIQSANGVTDYLKDVFRKIIIK